MSRTDETLLRDETIEPYLSGFDQPVFRLRVWDTNRRDNLGKNIVEYLFEQDGVEIFAELLHVGFGTAVDSNSVVRSVMSHVCLRMGDTDAEYFDEYNDVQRAFADKHAEALGAYADYKFSDEQEEEEVA